MWRGLACRTWTSVFICGYPGCSGKQWLGEHNLTLRRSCRGARSGNDRHIAASALMSFRWNASVIMQRRKQEGYSALYCDANTRRVSALNGAATLTFRREETPHAVISSTTVRWRGQRHFQRTVTGCIIKHLAMSGCLEIKSTYSSTTCMRCWSIKLLRNPSITVRLPCSKTRQNQLCAPTTVLRVLQVHKLSIGSSSVAWDTSGRYRAWAWKDPPTLHCMGEYTVNDQSTGQGGNR